MSGNGSGGEVIQLPGIPQPAKRQHKVFVALGQVEAIFAPCPCGNTTALVNQNAFAALRKHGEGLTIACGQCGDELYLMLRRVISK